ncbi:AimR family lysis-lysogeny pheromone receptor [Bacillus albus]|uniref:AimR family lysis-lysogeny pheromone receptor n=1 Tax=Bacillus cereus group TaxID=86661 RepID=UPI0022E59B8E|nr:MULTISPECIES: AimR family lysis-lysogeny pheromone receptor [Bacillus cereus group]MDA2320248.1 AimR family lysis-lysogeny pheromone receptor [Bacillus cereus group sp. Bc177]MED2186488.1 AimR family lysis-lysogeny pheromone receptor [Bacillus wiedmannii]
MWKALGQIEKELCVAGIRKNKLADHWGVKPSTVTKVFKGNTDISFGFLSKTIILLNKGIQVQGNILKNYIDVTNPKSENLREAMEDLALRGKFDLLIEVINSELHSKVSENKEFASVYLIIYKRYIGELNAKMYYKALHITSKSVKTIEMELLTEILLCQAQYQTGNYTALNERLKSIETKIDKISNKYLRECFKLRYREAIAVTSLQGGEVDEARNVCIKLIDDLEWDNYFSFPKVNAYLKLGESYIFSVGEYENSKYYLEKTLQVIGDRKVEAVEKKKEMVQHTLSFLKIHHDKEISDTDVIHPSELAYLMIKQGNTTGAREMLNQIKSSTGELTDIQTTYLALTYEGAKREELMKQSLLMCQKSGNIFYSNLPKIHLGLI